MAKAHVVLARANSRNDNGDGIPLISELIGATAPNAPIIANAGAWTSVLTGVKSGQSNISLAVPENQGRFVLSVTALEGPLLALVAPATANLSATPNAWAAVFVAQNQTLEWGGLVPGTVVWVRDYV